MAVAGGINGFGRIGRLVARIMAKSDAIDLKLVNSGAANEYMAYQFKYDSIHGRYPGTIEPTADGLIILYTVASRRTCGRPMTYGDTRACANMRIAFVLAALSSVAVDGATMSVTASVDACSFSLALSLFMLVAPHACE